MVEYAAFFSPVCFKWLFFGDLGGCCCLQPVGAGVWGLFHGVWREGGSQLLQWEWQRSWGSLDSSGLPGSGCSCGALAGAVLSPTRP